MLDTDEADELDVPIGWFRAEQLAKDLVLPVKGPLRLNVFECDAAQTVLALTLLFTGIADQPGKLSHEQLQQIRDLIAPGVRWLLSCGSLFEAAYMPASTLEFARQAFQWLLLVSPTLNGQAEQSPGTGWRVGQKHALRVLDAPLDSRLGFLASPPAGARAVAETGWDPTMDGLPARGTWLAWGLGVPADLFDGYQCSNVSVYDDDLIAMIRAQDPEWPPPNDDVEDLDNLNESWAIEVAGITEQEARDETSMYPDEIRGLMRIW
jgi:hypothetical protein